ncbi:MAG: GNAT family protein [Candidatus Omnitrophota bacterium]
MGKLKHFIEGANIYLRDVSLGDVNDVYLGWMNDPEVTRYLEARFSEHTLESIRDYVEKMASKEDEVFLAICEKDSRKHIGNIKLGPIERNHKFAYISLVIGDKAFWGKGIASEAIGLMVKIAFDKYDLNKLLAGCYACNRGSARAFEKNGFKVEGVEKRRWLSGGEYVDGITLGLVRDEAVRGEE